MTVIIPAFKPDTKILNIVNELKKETDYSIIIVNDGSGNDYLDIFEILTEQGCHVISNETNSGKGTALKLAFSFVLNNSEEDCGVVTADADGQHLVKDIIKVAKLIENTSADIVLGGRNFSGNVPLKSKIGNYITRFIFFISSGKYIKDTQTGLRGIKKTVISELLKAPGTRYEYETNMLFTAVSKEYCVVSTPIDTVYAKGNSITHFRGIRDSFIIYKSIVKFILSSLSAFLIDFMLLFVFTNLTKGLGQTTSLLLSATLARIISSICNFFINYMVVFNHNRTLKNSIFKYFLLALCVFLFNISLVYLFNIILQMRLFYSKLLAEMILFSFSYIVQRLFIFKTKQDK